MMQPCSVVPAPAEHTLCFSHFRQVAARAHMGPQPPSIRGPAVRSGGHRCNGRLGDQAAHGAVPLEDQRASWVASCRRDLGDVAVACLLLWQLSQTQVHEAQRYAGGRVSSSPARCRAAGRSVTGHQPAQGPRCRNAADLSTGIPLKSARISSRNTMSMVTRCCPKRRTACHRGCRSAL